MSLKNLLFGEPLATHEEGEQRVGPLAGIPMLGLDALRSAAYGPEAAMQLLIPLGALSVGYIGPISIIIIALLFILYLSYRQTISAYPAGGGSYAVARRNLGVFPGLLAAAALLLDYVLVVAVGISAGVGALVSALPTLQPYTLWLCLGILLLIALVNLRGVRESGVAFIVPTYLFVICLFSVLVIGGAKSLLGSGRPAPVVAPPALSAATATASLWLLLQAFSSGCTAMTGVEAVSNGVTAFREPSVRNARRTLTAIILILATLLAGIAYLSKAYAIGATAPGQPGYQSVLSQLIAAVVGQGFFYYSNYGRVPRRRARGVSGIILILARLVGGIAYLSKAYAIGATAPGQPGYQSVLSQLIAAVVGKGFFYYLSIGAILAVLALSANTGFADFPRLCRAIAQHGFLPRVFASRGRRLVYSQGIYALTLLSALLLIIFGGVTDRLIPLFAIGAFLAFTLSQAGMVEHWRRVGGRRKLHNMLINGVGAVATGVT